MVCNGGIILAAVGTYKLGPRISYSSICQVKCQHESEAVLRVFQRVDAPEAEAARQAKEVSHLLSIRQLKEARLNIIELEARLSAREITANIMQRTLEERLALMQSSHSSDDPSDGDKADLSPRRTMHYSCFYCFFSPRKQTQFSPRKQLTLCHSIDMLVCCRPNNHAINAPEGAGDR